MSWRIEIGRFSWNSEMLVSVSLLIVYIRSLDSLIRMDVYDREKEVRIRALNCIANNTENAKCNPTILISCLSDHSFKVRRLSMPLIANTYKYDIMLTHSIIQRFIDQFFFASYNEMSMKRLKGSCSVLPAIAWHFLPIYPSFYTTILCQIAAPRSLFSQLIRHHKTVKLRA